MEDIFDRFSRLASLAGHARQSSLHFFPFPLFSRSFSLFSPRFVLRGGAVENTNGRVEKKKRKTIESHWKRMKTKGKTKADAQTTRQRKKVKRLDRGPSFFGFFFLGFLIHFFPFFRPPFLSGGAFTRSPLVENAVKTFTTTQNQSKQIKMNGPSSTT